MKKTPSKYFVFIGLFFTSLSSIFVRFSDAPPLIISMYRMLFTVLILLIPVLSKNKKEIRNIKQHDFILCILSGIFLALHFFTWITSLQMTSIASSTVLVSTNPIFVAFLSFIIFKERLSKKSILGIAIAIVGSIVIALADTKNSNIHAIQGDLLAFLGSIFIAGYFIVGRIVRKRLSAGSYVFVVYTTSTIVLLLLCIISKTPLYPYPLKEFAIFLAMAVFCSILGHTVYNWMVQYLPATFISTATLGEPIFASSLALILFKEFPNPLTFAGGFIIILGIYCFIKYQ